MRTINNKGLTLVEIMVVVALITILVALATPRVNETMSQFQFSNSMRLLLGTIARTKGEAVNTSFPCSVFFSTDADGRVNYTAFVDNGAGGGTNGNSLRDGTETIIQTGRMPNGVTINLANTTLPIIQVNGVNCQFTQFNSLGFAMGFQAGAPALYAGNIELNKTIGGQAITRSIQLGVGGNLRILP